VTPINPRTATYKSNRRTLQLALIDAVRVGRDEGIAGPLVVVAVTVAILQVIPAVTRGDISLDPVSIHSNLYSIAIVVAGCVSGDDVVVGLYVHPVPVVFGKIPADHGAIRSAMSFNTVAIVEARDIVNEHVVIAVARGIVHVKAITIVVREVCDQLIVATPDIEPVVAVFDGGVLNQQVVIANNPERFRMVLQMKKMLIQ